MILEILGVVGVIAFFFIVIRLANKDAQEGGFNTR